jgi:hypothetical protein
VLHDHNNVSMVHDNVSARYPAPWWTHKAFAEILGVHGQFEQTCSRVVELTSFASDPSGAG